MINFRVFRLGDLVKILVKLLALVIGVIIFAGFFNSIRKINFQSFVESRKQELENKTLIECLDDNLDKPYKKEKEQNLISKELEFIRSVFSSAVVATATDNTEVVDTATSVSESDTGDVQVSPTTQVVQEHNKKDVYNVTYSSVQIRNQTSTELIQEMLIPDVSFDLSNIVVFHTHTSESYTPTELYSYQASGNFRTLDTRCSVVGLGNELANRLAKKNINVIHDSTFHDYPEYNGAYTRSAQTVQNVLAGNSADLVIDLHRDALADSTYAPSVMIGEEKAAQIMFVMGSNEGGLEHPNWNTNLKIAVKIQEKANEMYPGLFKPIMLTKYRYNQHLAKGSCIMEIGATGNTMEECLVSMKYLAEVIGAVNEE